MTEIAKNKTVAIFKTSNQFSFPSHSFNFFFAEPLLEDKKTVTPFWISENYERFPHLFDMGIMTCKHVGNTGVYTPHGQTKTGHCVVNQSTYLVGVRIGSHEGVCKEASKYEQWWPSTTPVSWNQASQWCVSIGLFLPILRTSSEMEEFIGFIMLTPQYLSSEYDLHSPSAIGNEFIFLGLIQKEKQVGVEWSLLWAQQGCVDLG